MSTVPSVNPDPAPVADSEASDAAWIDPIFGEEALGDEPAPDTVSAGDKETDGKDRLSPEQLKALLAEHPETGGDDGEDEDEPEEGSDAEEAKADDKADDGEARKPRRRSKARRERREMQRTIRELQTQVRTLTDVLGGKSAPVPNPAEKANEAEEAKAPEGPPKLEDCDFDTDKWSAAMGEWTEKRIAAVKDEAKQAEAKKAEEAAQQRIAEAWKAFQDREEDARDRHDDYDDAVYDTDIFIPEAARDLIVESEIGPEIAYYLATHQDEAEKMRDASPVAVARAIGRIEARLQAAEAKPAKTPAEAAEEAPNTEQKPAEQAKPAAKPKPATKAPDPISTVSGGAAAGRDPSKMPYEEYREARMSGKLR